MRWNSLSTRIVVTFAVLVMSVMLVVTAFSYLRTKDALENMLENHGRMLAGAMEAVAAEHLVLYDYVYLRNYVTEVTAKEPVVSFAAVTNQDGTVVAHSDHAQEGKKAEAAAAAGGAAAVRKESAISERVVAYKGNRVLELTLPVAISGKQWGKVQLGVNYRDVDSVLHRLALSVVLVGGLLLVLSVLGARSFIGRMTSDINKVIDSAGKIAAGELREQVSEKGVDEVRALARAFNAMAENLRTVLRQIQETGAGVGSFSSSITSVIQDQAASASQQATSV
ncbi:MAG: HAMP domain-containing protein, partial [Deltaproteobacteria bacterium]|nr:HAMP domain-containing protein [Deltaproteobacteria bacterium]